jgi:hypothetical protein
VENLSRYATQADCREWNEGITRLVLSRPSGVSPSRRLGFERSPILIGVNYTAKIPGSSSVVPSRSLPPEFSSSCREWFGVSGKTRTCLKYCNKSQTTKKQTTVYGGAAPYRTVRYRMVPYCTVPYGTGHCRYETLTQISFALTRLAANSEPSVFTYRFRPVFRVS